MITIATFEKAEEAHLARSILEGSGIYAYVEGDLVVTVAWYLSSAIGGVKLQVMPEDAEDARDVLREAHCLPPTSSPEDPTCPHCLSGKVEYQKWSPRFFFLTLLFLGVPLPFAKRKFQCLECGRQWRGRRQ